MFRGGARKGLLGRGTAAPGCPGKHLRHRESSSTPAESPKTGSGCPPPPRVFLSKSAEAIENKGRRTEKERQERKRVRKDKELKEIEEEDAKGSAGFVRDNTANHTTV